MDNDISPGILCAENISLLFVLHKVPSLPKVTPFREGPTGEAGYSLPFEKERGLASTLAFLSSIRDDPNRIPALCIENLPGCCALKVHVAVNKDSFVDGDTHLREMNSALTKILAPLAASSNTDDQAVRMKTVFDVIVAVCEERILSRLHLRPSKQQKIKKPAVETLSLATRSLRELHKKISSRGALVESASKFEDRANGAIRLITAWTKHQTTARLRDVVEAIHELYMIERLDELLDCIPNNLMDPNLRDSLHNMIRKVARYKEAARYLCRLAMKFPCVRRAEVVSVTLQRQMFTKPEVDGYAPSLSATLHRISSKHGGSASLSRICTLLKVDAVHAERLFSDHVLRALQGAKIHAEIQLFYHIEMLRLTQPHVWSVQFHSPKCHGRLYPGWRLPVLPVQDETQRMFNDLLEQEVCNSIKNLFKTKKKFSLPDPRESTVLTIRQSSSTLASQSENLDAARDGSNMVSDKTGSDGSRPSTIKLSNNYLHATQDILEHPVTCRDGKTAKQSIASDTSHDRSRESLSFGIQGEADQKHDLGRSDPINLCVAPDNASCFRLGPIKLHVDYSAAHDGSTGDGKRELKFDAEWITDIGDQVANNHSGSPLIDIGKSTYTASLPSDQLNELYISHEGGVLRIRLHP